jgi:hypothetical protein
LTYHVNVAPGTADANTGSVSTTSSVTTLGSSPTLKSVVWNPLSHKVEVETLVPHFMPKYGASANMVVMAGGSYTNPFNTGVYEPATVVDSTHFTYDLASDPVVTVDSGSLSTSRPSNTTSSASYFYSGVYLPNVLYDSIEGYSMGDISDGQKVGGGTANIGDLVTGGGSQHISVIWTQNGWMRRG